MDRRAFLKKAGLGSIALGSAPALASILATPALAGNRGNGERHATFVALSKAETVDGVDHHAILEGRVSFNPEAGTATGGGMFLHFDNAPAGTPKPILECGKWETTRFVSWDHDSGRFCRINSSILELGINLVPDSGEPAVEATLRLICNIGPAGITTGEREGFVLTIPDAPFGSFRPLEPQVGVTHISIPEGESGV